MPWRDIFIIGNTVDTFAGAVFLVGSYLGFRAWWKGRKKNDQLDMVSSDTLLMKIPEVSYDEWKEATEAYLDEADKLGKRIR